MQRMTYSEIKKNYPDEWVLIDEPEVDEALEVRSGIVVAHNSRRDPVYAVFP